MITQSQKKRIILVLAVIIVVGFLLIKTGSEKKIKGPESTDFRQPPPAATLSDFSLKEKAYLDVINGDPENAEAYALLGDLYFENRRFEESITQYNKALSLNPQDVDSYNDLGLALHYSGQTDKAIEILKKGTEIGPSYQRIWLSYGFIMTNAGKRTEAEKVLKKVIEMDPGTDIAEDAKRILDFLRASQ